MINTKVHYRQAVDIITQVTILMDEGNIAQQIDGPINKVVSEFECIEHPGYSHELFHKTITDFVQSIYEKVPFYGRKLSSSQAHDEAVALLEYGYRGIRGNGYDAAVLDSNNPRWAGLRLVINLLAESLKSQMHQKHTQWVKARYIDSADWYTKCIMAKILHENCGDCLDPELRNSPPEQLAENVFELFGKFMEIKKTRPQW